MKKLILLLLFIPLVSFGQEGFDLSRDWPLPTIILIIVIFFTVLYIYNTIKEDEEKERYERWVEVDNYLRSSKMLGCINTETGCWSHNEYLIRDFILGIHKPENLDKQTLLRKEKNPEYVEIWGDEDELKLISIIRNIKKDSHKLRVRFLLQHIYDKPFITYIYTKIKKGLIGKNDVLTPPDSIFRKVSEEADSKREKILKKGALDLHLSKHPISPKFFSCSDDKFLKIINSDGNSVKEIANEIKNLDSDDEVVYRKKGN